MLIFAVFELQIYQTLFLFPWKPWTLHYKRLFFICFRQVSIEQIQTSIIHLAPCSQEIHVIDNENPIFLRFVFLEEQDAK